MATTLLTSTTLERQQAIQQLEAAYTQPNGSMVFTFKGHQYKSLGMNANSTLHVVDMATGAILDIDPAEVYIAARAASGDPVQAPESPSASSTSAGKIVQQIMAKVGTYYGLANLATQTLGHWAMSAATQTGTIIAPTAEFGAGSIPEWAVTPVTGSRVQLGSFFRSPIFTKTMGAIGAVMGSYSEILATSSFYEKQTLSGAFNLGMSAFSVATGINALLGSNFVAAMTNPAGWFAAGAIMAGTFAYKGINDWITNGFSFGAFATTAASVVGVAVFTNLLIHALAFSGPIGWAAAIGVVLFSALWSLFHQPSDEEVAGRNLTQALAPIVWVGSPLVLVGAGTIAALMGWNSGATPPTMATLSVPSSYAVSAVASRAIYDIQGGTPFSPNSVTVVVSSATPTQPGQVVIVSPAGADSNGKTQFTMTSYQLRKDLQFVSSANIPTEGSYIPFFLTHSGNVSKDVNPAIKAAITTEVKMLQSILSGYLSTADALSAMLYASTANKIGITAN